ncbi:Wzz/FepE/Etk N-terminal domain-containing protein [Aquibium sp. LZ166]|uniref:Wzz/FepE/Etk N-terminal domain-containing protein n=1 Tax=Aquibium pacificus TaxID=3153579 RepID=A0ABV3SCP0_9HYPH
MSESESRDLPERKGSLLSLVSARSRERGDSAGPESREAEPVDWKSYAAERHRLARSRREAAKSPLLAALSKEPIATKDDDVPFREQERELRDIFESEDRPVAEVARPQARPQAAEIAASTARRSQGPDTEFEPRDRARHARASNSASDGDGDWRPLIDPLKVMGGVWKSRYLIVGAAIAGAVIAALLAISTPKKYTAGAELLIDPRQLQIVGNEVTGGGGLSTEATLAIVENQVRVLTSGSVLSTVVDKLGLASDPEFNGTEESAIGRYIPNIRKILFSGGDTADPSILRKALAVETLAKSLEVQRGGRTFVVEIYVETESPEKSALIANTLTEVFLEAYGAIQSRTVGRASDELTQRLAELRRSVEEAERKVETFKSENDIVDAQGRLISDDEIVKLNDQLAIARARTLELQARADSTRDLTVDAILAGNLPEQMSSPVLTEMRSQYSLLRQEADRVSARLGPRHPERVAIEEQVGAARGRIEQELRLVASSIQVELRRAVQLEQELAARLAQLKARQANLSGELVTLRELEREASAKRAVYEAFLLRARETGEQKDMNTANVSVISAAMPPLQPSSMSRASMTIFGAFLGLGLGLMFGIGRGTFDSLRDDVRSQGGARGSRRDDTPAPQPPQGRAAAAAPVPDHEQGPGSPAPQPDMQPFGEASVGAYRSTGIPSEAYEENQADESATTAEEARMYHTKPQNPWAPAQQADHPSAPQGYAPSHQAGPAWHDRRHYTPDAYGQSGQQPDYPAHQYQPYGTPPAYAQAPFQPYPQPVAHPSGYGDDRGQAGYPGHGAYPSMPMGYGQAPAAGPYWQPAPQGAPGGYGYPGADPRQGFGPAPYAQGGYNPAPYPRPSLEEVPAQREAAAAQNESRQAASADSTAINEIRESLREFREALRELAENRGRRRFL